MTMMLMVLILPIGITLICCGPQADKVIHRRNFSKSFFEEQFSQITIACNQKEGKVLFPEIKMLKIAPAHFNKSDERYIFQKGERFTMAENTFNHELYLEEIKDSAFMFRYNSTLIDTLRREDSDEFTIQLTDDKGRVICRCDSLIN